MGILFWMALSRTASYSFKKWDASFDSVFRFSLREMGLSDADILSQYNQIKKDAHGEFISQNVTLKIPQGQSLEKLKDNFEKAGAQVTEDLTGPRKRLIIKRGNRIFQEILIAKN